MDTVTKEKRSWIMSRIRSRDTKPEVRMAQALRRAGASGWRRHHRVEGMRPDFVWRRERVVVLIQGCFWHGCPVHYRCPQSNVVFWREKVRMNRARDRRQSRLLRSRGWTVLHVFECRIRNLDRAVRVAARIRDRRLHAA
jgi:DNA mismatch endonuclease (patch repair protein)